MDEGKMTNVSLTQKYYISVMAMNESTIWVKQSPSPFAYKKKNLHLHVWQQIWGGKFFYDRNLIKGHLHLHSPIEW